MISRFVIRSKMRLACVKAPYDGPRANDSSWSNTVEISRSDSVVYTHKKTLIQVPGSTFRLI